MMHAKRNMSITLKIWQGWRLWAREGPLRLVSKKALEIIGEGCTERMADLRKINAMSKWRLSCSHLRKVDDLPSHVEINFDTKTSFANSRGSCPISNASTSSRFFLYCSNIET
jgi:hypothetical protein